MTSKQALANYLESEEFYNLMNQYRHTPINQQQMVVEAFEKVKQALLLAVDAEHPCHCGAQGVYQLPSNAWVCYTCFSEMEITL
jgi:hypothetical protein